MNVSDIYWSFSWHNHKTTITGDHILLREGDKFSDILPSTFFIRFELESHEAFVKRLWNLEEFSWSATEVTFDTNTNDILTIFHTNYTFWSGTKICHINLNWLLQISWLRIVFASNKNFYFGIQYCRQRLVPLYWQHGLDLNKKCREEYKVRLIGSWALYCQWKICKFNTKLGFKVLSYKFYLMVSNFIWDWH